MALAVLNAQTPATTFHKDVEGILQRNCQACHRPGQMAPMSLQSGGRQRQGCRSRQGCAEQAPAGQRRGLETQNSELKTQTFEERDPSRV